MHVSGETTGDGADDSVMKSVEARREKVMVLHCRSLNQGEIDEKLGTRQSTINRDPQQIKRKSFETRDGGALDEKHLEKSTWAAGLDEIIKKAWDLVEDEKADHRSKTGVLMFLTRCNDKRLPNMGRPS